MRELGNVLIAIITGRLEKDVKMMSVHLNIQIHEFMSGECEKCGDHAVDCDCEEQE